MRPSSAHTTTRTTGRSGRQLTCDWVGWYNRDRMMERLERSPSVEYEADYDAKVSQQRVGG